MNRVYPGARQQPGQNKIIRRVYIVAGLHQLWHLDGYHELIRCNFDSRWNWWFQQGGSVLVLLGSPTVYSKFSLVFEQIDGERASW